jgi:MraZ protein
MLFTGQTLGTIDNKKRLVIPAKFRGGFSSATSNRAVCITARATSRGSFLVISTPESLEEENKRLTNVAHTSEDADWFRRKYIADTETCHVDNQWRLVVPTRLLKQVGLGHEVVLLGVGSSIEVWDSSHWRALDQQLLAELPALQRAVYEVK